MAITRAQEGANANTIAQFLAAKGLTQPQVAGVLGNFEVESTFDPADANPGEGAIGIAQWEKGRRKALDSYAVKTGGSETDLNTQLGYLWQELSGPESASLKALENTTDAGTAATVFDQKFERSAPDSLPMRVANAQSFATGTAVPGSQIQTASLIGIVGDLASGGVSGPVNELAGGAASAAAGKVTSAVGGALAGPLFEGGALLVAGALVVFGLYQAFKPAIHSTAGAVSAGAGNVAKLAALA